MKKLQVLSLFFISVIPYKVFAKSNHYTDYVYENYLKGKLVNDILEDILNIF